MHDTELKMYRRVLYSFARAAVTKYHKLVGLKQWKCIVS